MESTNAENVANGIVSKNNTQTSKIQELQKEASKLRKTIVEQDQKIEMLTEKPEKHERSAQSTGTILKER